jgi:hypothetical protein
MREFFGEQLGKQFATSDTQADLIAGNNVYAHVPDINDFTLGMQAALKPGGVFLLEAYTPAQIQHGTGGGKSEELMQTAALLRAELPGLDFVHLVELERDVVEGVFHTGLGAVVQAIGVKPA